MQTLQKELKRLEELMMPDIPLQEFLKSVEVKVNSLHKWHSKKTIYFAVRDLFASYSDVAIRRYTRKNWKIIKQHFKKLGWSVTKGNGAILGYPQYFYFEIKYSVTRKAKKILKGKKHESF